MWSRSTRDPPSALPLGTLLNRGRESREHLANATRSSMPLRRLEYSAPPLKHGRRLCDCVMCFILALAGQCHTHRCGKPRHEITHFCEILTHPCSRRSVERQLACRPLIKSEVTTLKAKVTTHLLQGGTEDQKQHVKSERHDKTCALRYGP